MPAFAARLAPALTLALALVLATPAPCAGAPPQGPGFPGTAELSARATALAREQPDLVRLETLGSGVPLLTVSHLAPIDQPRHPAALVIAGLEPNDLTGPLSTFLAAEALTADARTNPATRRALESSSILFLPVAIPGESQRQSSPHAERTVGPLPPTDDDHDGLVDEDPAEDLNGDGRIASMRVEDPAGEYILDPAENRLLMKADRTRGEAGAWRLLTEGRDNDGDEDWNEDGPGGINPNRNFPAGYAYFGAGAGPHPLSDPSTRALADFIITRPNLALVFTFSSVDNLTQAPKAEPGGKRPATAIHEADLPWVAELGKAWRKSLGLEKDVPGAAAPGSFPDWIYLHRGRLSLAARPWFTALARTLSPAAPTTNAAAATPAPSPATEPANPPAAGASPPPAPPSPKPPSKPEPDKRNEEERDWLHWTDTNAPAAFVPWQRIEHPDFPGRRVEVGGFAPWVRSNPPESLLPALAERHRAFLIDLPTRLPRIGIRRSQVTALGNGVFDIRVEVENTGWLPTVLAHGETTGEVTPSRITLGLPGNAFLSGSRSQRLPALPGSGGMHETRWVVLAPGTLTTEVEVITTLAGRARATLTLPGEPR